MADGRLFNGGARDGSGRKPDALKVELRDLLNEAVPRDKRLEMLEILSVSARSGNVKAAAFLLDRMYGKPTQTIELHEDSDNPPLNLNHLNESELDILAGLLRKAAGLDGERTAESDGSGAGTEPPALSA